MRSNADESTGHSLWQSIRHDATLTWYCGKPAPKAIKEMLEGLMNPAFVGYDVVKSTHDVFGELKTKGGVLVRLRGYRAIPLLYGNSRGRRRWDIDAIVLIDDFAVREHAYPSVRRASYVHVKKTRFPAHIPPLSGSGWWTWVLDSSNERICVR